MLSGGKQTLGSQVTPEFMQSQIEVGSNICRNIKEARYEMARLRRSMAELASNNGLAIIAAGTHPFSRWADQQVSDYERYQRFRDSYGLVARSLLIFGMHVHIGFGTSREALNLMIDVFNQLRYVLPHILALSSSSPFWEGRDTGLKSYRSVVWENMPRTGIPPNFSSYSDYDDFVELLGKTQIVAKDEKSGKPDNTMIWWDARPRPALGTIEVRISDMCTTIDETICIAAIIQTFALYFIKLRESNLSWRIYRTKLIEENKWRAMRHGIDGKMIDFGKEQEVATRFLLREALELIQECAEELGTQDEIAYLETILEQGTSADRQLATYRRALATGATEQDALVRVVDTLIEETRQSL